MARVTSLLLMLLVFVDTSSWGRGHMVCLDVPQVTSPPATSPERTCSSCPGESQQPCCDCRHVQVSEQVDPGPCSPPNPICMRAADIVFVLDESNSIPRDSFIQQLEFISKVISHFEVSQNNVHIGVMSFGLGVNTDIVSLGDFYYSKGAMQRRILAYIKERSPDNDRTRTDLALESCRTVMFRGARPGVAHIAIMITDAEPNLPQVSMEEGRRITKQKADELKATGVTLFAVGVGDQANQAQLEQIASGRGRDYVFMVDSSHLAEIVEELATRICPQDGIIKVPYNEE